MSEVSVGPNWKKALLGEVATCTLGGTPSTEIRLFWGGDIPWMASGDVHLRRIHDVPGRITKAGLACSNATMTKPPAVAVGLAGQGKTRGTVALTLRELCTNQSIALLKGDQENLLTEFLFHNLDRRYEELRARSSGGGRGGLSKGILGKVPMELPSLPIQSKIAEILDTLDAAIRGTEAVVAKLKAMKQGLLHDLLTRGINANGALRPPQPNAPNLYKQTTLGWLPKEWGTSKLPGLAQSNRPVIKTGPFGSSLKGEHWRETGRPVITIGSFGESGFIEDELLFIDEKKAKSMIEYEVHYGDVVFSRVADVGRSLVVEEKEAGWIMSSNLMRICVDRKKLLPALLHIQLRHSVRLRKQMSRLVNSAGRDVANSAVLLALDIAVPPGFEQIEIEKAIVCNDEKLVKEEQQLNKLRVQKSGLMDDLLTGRRPVTAQL